GALLPLALVVGCTSFGPQTMREQQADYAAAVADGGKRQTLLNIVRLRYGDVPAFLSVSQILAGYSLQGTFSAGTDILSGGSLRLSDDANVGVGGTFTNNPTVTYAPVTGANFARTFLAPMQPADLFGLMLGGTSPSLVLGLGLHSIGGYANERASAESQVAADPGFAEVLALLIELQHLGRLSIQLAVVGQDRLATLGLAVGETEDGPERRLRRLLDLPPDQTTFPLVYTLGAPRPGQIAIRTRSLIEVLSQLAGDIEVPEGDVADGSTYAGLPFAGSTVRLPRITVDHGVFEPRQAYAAANYNGTWFWIGAGDLESKRVFSFVMLLLSLSESSRPDQPPVISIPAG
ncbi:MAG: hypothetical protein AB7X49_21285, partial [Geminicoccaceae bacterium]